MTVAELIRKLEAYPQDLRVMVEGYEGRYEDIEDFFIIDIYSYGGSDKEKVQALIIERKS